ncbi:hypothetical protein KM043_017969 [Ampulex compressa]|nr:hypothetical protein KM043_017969 [Ampulex compressa]
MAEQSKSSLDYVQDEVNVWRNFNDDLLETNIDEDAIHRKVEDIRCKASGLDGNDKTAWLLQAIGFIDLTSLGGNDTSATIEALCKRALTPVTPTFVCPKELHTAAVCVYPARISDAITALESIDATSKISIASVAAGFPSGQYPLKTRLFEIQYAVETGAQEIDIVINRTLAIEQNWKKLYEELVLMRDACGSNVHMKTILATGELPSLKDVYKASMVAILAGSDFIKTSTGKEAVNATLPVGLVMCKAIKDYYKLTHKKIGLKPAGGIKTAQDVLDWMTLIKVELGDEWLNKELFRIGASSVLDSIAAALK